MTGDYKSNGARLAYADSGSGPPVVFLHPTPLDGDFWRPLASRLPNIRVIVPDLRAHGQSELGANLPVGEFARIPDAPSIPMRLYAADILALLDYLDLAQAIFAGCSIGGYVLLELWRQAPQRISSLAFLCSKPQPDAEANLVKRAATIAQARAGDLAAIYDGMAQLLIGPTARKAISLAIEPETESDQEKMSVAVSKLFREDPTFMVRTDQDSGQMVISGKSQLHLEDLVNRMKREASVGEPKVRQVQPVIVSELRSRMTLSAEALVAVQAGLATRPDSILTVATINVPVLAIAGGEDPVCPPAEMESFRSARGGCEFHVIPDAGHFAAYEQPETVASLLAPWLQKHQ